MEPSIDPAFVAGREPLSDEQIVARALAGEGELFELLMRRYNQRLFRTLRAALRDDDAAEEALQQTWIAVWRALPGFAGRASFPTWATRIALRTASRVRRRELRAFEIAQAASDRGPASASEGEPVDDGVARRELVIQVVRAIDELPEPYRVVIVLRAVEGLSTAEVADALEIEEGAVKVRLHRARERLKQDLLARAESTGVLAETWEFDGHRCDRVVAGVLAVLRREDAR